MITRGWLPPLENGDRLTRSEFERRYEAMPHPKKAELIEGVVYIPSPVRHTQHREPHAHLIGLLGRYAAYSAGVQVGDNRSARASSAEGGHPIGRALRRER